MNEKPTEQEHCRLFGKGHAFTLYPSLSRSGQYTTVIIEAAAALPGQARRFDWAQRSQIAPGAEDIHRFVAVLLRQEAKHECRTQGGTAGLIWQDTSGGGLSAEQVRAYPLVLRSAKFGGSSHQVPVSIGNLPVLAACFVRVGAINLGLDIPSYLALVKAVS